MNTPQDYEARLTALLKQNARWSFSAGFLAGLAAGLLIGAVVVNHLGNL